MLEHTSEVVESVSSQRQAPELFPELRQKVLGVLVPLVVLTSCTETTPAQVPLSSPEPIVATKPIAQVPVGSGIVRERPLETLPTIPAERVQEGVEQVIDKGTEMGKQTWEWMKQVVANGKAVVDGFRSHVKIEVEPSRVMGDTLLVQDFPLTVQFRGVIPEGSMLGADATFLWQIHEVQRRFLVNRQEGALVHEAQGDVLQYTFQKSREYVVKMSAYSGDKVYTTSVYLLPSVL